MNNIILRKRLGYCYRSVEMGGGSCCERKEDSHSGGLRQRRMVPRTFLDIPTSFINYKHCPDNCDTLECRYPHFRSHIIDRLQQWCQDLRTQLNLHDWNKDAAMGPTRLYPRLFGLCRIRRLYTSMKRLLAFLYPRTIPLQLPQRSYLWAKEKTRDLQR